MGAQELLVSSHSNTIAMAALRATEVGHLGENSGSGIGSIESALLAIVMILLELFNCLVAHLV